MPKIKIDDIEYDLDRLSESAQGNLTMLRACEAEIQRLQLLLAISQTARNAYASALRAALPSPLDQTLAQGETLKLS